jgi:hypothetical protein
MRGRCKIGLNPTAVIMARVEAVTIAEIVENKSPLCREILASLPRWFGIPEAVDAYVRGVADLPMLAAFANGIPIGFLALKDHIPSRPRPLCCACGRNGTARASGASCSATRRLYFARGVRFLTVKTVAAPDDDPVYGATRRFYEAIGFMPIEVFPTLWHERNPCLFMLKSLG